MVANRSTYIGCLDALTWRFHTRMSRAEALLWGELKGRRLRGHRFERRRQVDRYVVDFYCRELRLAVDVFIETPWHARCVEDDRSTRLRLCGTSFLRFSEDEILRDLDGVVARILQVAGHITGQ